MTIRSAIDIGGTYTDLLLDRGGLCRVCPTKAYGYATTNQHDIEWGR